ncbi:MAG: NAD(P)H-hydrate dehydratase [Candidatus Aenigmatarchaeota archaeon]
MISKAILKKVYKKRDDWSCKYDFGSLLVVGGSKSYHGSPTFNALAALRSGCDLVTVVAPERAANIIASYSPDLITYPLKGDFLRREHLNDLLKLAEKKAAVVVGGGLGRDIETMMTVDEFLKRTDIPCVIDADAIHAVAKNKKAIKSNHLITPHTREFFALSGIKLRRNISRREEFVQKIAKELGCTILLKGFVDVISDGRKTEMNKTGNPYMTKGGTGDTLAGICGSLLAQGINVFDAACAAAYINGAAGDLAAKEKKQSLLASDLIEKISEVIKLY